MKFSENERRAKGRVKLHRARGSAELREVASGSATQRLDIGEREKQVVCYASALALAMTDDARREAEMLAWRSSSLL